MIKAYTINFEPDLEFLAHEMHTAGEPLRIMDWRVPQGRGYQTDIPRVEGKTILEKQEFIQKNLDKYRRILIDEPRGHKDMYGAILLNGEGENNFCLIFLTNLGYSPMCGHAVIAMARYVLDRGLVHLNLENSTITFQCPCGIIKAFVDTENKNSWFHSVPSFVCKLDAEVEVENLGTIVVDICYGGAFYAIVTESKLNLSIKDSPISEIVNVASAITEAVKIQHPVEHPKHKKLSFIYGTIITDGKDKFDDGPSTNVCVYADKAVDRSPTGSGVCARIALQIKRGEMDFGQEKEFRSIADTSMTGKALEKVKFYRQDAVIVQVGGKAYHTAYHRFIRERDDPVDNGFQLRR